MKKLLHPSGDGARLLYLVISGMLAGFCITFPSVPGAVLEWAVMIPASLALLSYANGKKPKYTRVWLCGFLFFMSEYLVIYHWFISLYPLDFTGMSRPYAICVVLLGWIGLSILAALTGGFVFLFTVLLLRCRAAAFHAWLKPLICGAMYSVFEWTQTIGWTGVAWNRLGLGQLAGNFTASVMPSSLFGPYFVTFVMVTVSFLLAQGLYDGKFKTRAIAAVLLAFAEILLGTVLYFIPMTPDGTVTAAAVQGNISSKEKWSETQYSETIRRYTDYTMEAAGNGAELVLWPETALPYYISETSELSRQLSGLAEDAGVNTVVGCFVRGEDDEPYNILRIYTREGGICGGFYAKRHLVPFGEYMPMRKLLSAVFPPLTEIAMLARDLVPGANTGLMEADGITVGGLICFDSIYEPLARRSAADGAQIFLLATNDSWFGDSAAVYMHNAQARMRAIENGRCVIRAANTGISSIIDEKGRVLSLLPPLEEGVLSGTVGVYSEKTLYTITGEWFIYFCIALCTAAAAWSTADKYRLFSFVKNHGTEAYDQNQRGDD